MGTYFRYICGLSRIEYELYGRDYRRHADLAVDGTDHGIRLGIGNLRFRVDQAIVQHPKFEAFAPAALPNTLPPPYIS